MTTTPQTPASQLRDAIAVFVVQAREFHASGALELGDDGEAIAAITAAGDALRAAESLLIAGAGTIVQRSARRVRVPSGPCMRQRTWESSIVSSSSREPFHVAQVASRSGYRRATIDPRNVRPTPGMIAHDATSEPAISAPAASRR